MRERTEINHSFKILYIISTLAIFMIPLIERMNCWIWFSNNYTHCYVVSICDHVQTKKDHNVRFMYIYMTMMIVLTM